MKNLRSLISASALVLTSVLALFALAAPTNAATSCDPTADADGSCGLKTAIEAKYGAGYCSDLYDWQDVGGATLEVHHRYTNAGIDSNGAGSITMEVFPTFTDRNCTVKTTSALEGNDPTYRFYHGIYINATTDITTTPGAEEIQVDLDTDDFEYTFTGLDFDEYQFRFDSDFYDESGETRYGSTTEQDYFAPAWPALDSLTMASDGEFQWDFASGPADDDTRADVVLYEITDDGLLFTTFTTKYAPTSTWEYYDWNNVGDGTYLLSGNEAKKSYYDDVYDGSNMDTSGQVNHGMWNEHTRKTVTIQSHAVTNLSSLDDLDEEVESNLVDCEVVADDGGNCTTVTESDIVGVTKPAKPTISKASKKKVKWGAKSGATFYKLRITNKSGKKTLLSYNNVTKTSQSITTKNRKKLKAVNKAQVRACNSAGCSAWSKAKQFKK